MTGGDLLVLAPWVIFGAGLALVCLRLRRSRTQSRLPSGPGQARRQGTGPEPGDAKDGLPRPQGKAAGRERHGARS